MLKTTRSLKYHAGWQMTIKPGTIPGAARIRAAVQNCINNLPEDFRSVVVMVDVEGMDYQEVSEAVGKPLGTIKSRLARAVCVCGIVWSPSGNFYRLEYVLKGRKDYESATFSQRMAANIGISG